MDKIFNIRKNYFAFFTILMLLTINFSTNIYGENFFKKLSSSLNMKGEKDLKNAELLYNQNKYVQAAALYKKYLDKNKKKPLPLINYKIGLCYFETENYEAAFPYIEKAYNFDKKNLDYQLLYAEALIMFKQVDEGILIYQKIVNDHPNDYLSHIRLGELYVDKGDLKKARKQWLEAIKIDKTKTNAYSLLTESYLKVENNKLEAFYYARKMYEYAPSNEKDQAASILKKIAGKFSEDFENQYQLRVCIENAKDFVNKNNYQKAYESLLKCKDMTGISDTYLILYAKVCENLKKHKEAANAYEKCIAIGYEKGEYYFNAALNYIKLNEINTAIVLLKKAKNFPETEKIAEKWLKQLKIKR